MKTCNLEQKISRTEEFSVIIRHSNGRDVRDDTDIPSNYNYNRKAKNSMTVSQWKEQRFYPALPGYDVDVLLGDESVATGQTILGTVRDSHD